MLQVSIDRLEPGMKLARPITKGNMVLLSKDTELAETLIRRIQNMGVDSVYIYGRSQQSIPKDEALAQLEKRFKNIENKPYMNLLKNIVRKHIEDLYD